MAYLKSKTLFFIISPRTPLKMIPEIEVLAKMSQDENEWYAKIKDKALNWL